MLNFSSLIKNVVALLLVLFAVVGNVCAQTFTTWGTEFWLPDERGWIEIQTGPNPTSITIEDISSGATTNFSYAPNSVNSIPINIGLGSAPVLDETLCITSDFPVNSRFIHENHKSGGGTNLIPTSQLGTYYSLSTMRIQHYENVSFNKNQPKILITATEDNTDINIIPTHESENGLPVNSTSTVQLNRGETYVLEGIDCGFYATTFKPACIENGDTTTNDFSGTRIFADSGSCNAIVVTLYYDGPGSVFGYPHGSCCTESVIEQYIPDKYWGDHFLFINEQQVHHGNHVKIFSKFDNDSIRFNNQLVEVLNENETFDTLIFDPVEIDCSKKSLVNHILLSFHVTESFIDPTLELGDTDPELFLVLPSNFQSTGSGRFNLSSSGYTYPNSLQDSCYLSIVTNSSNVGNLTLNGVAIPQSSFSSVHSQSSFSFAYIPLAYSLSDYVLSAASGEFQARVFAVCPQGSACYSLGVNAGGNGNASSVVTCIEDFPHELNSSGFAPQYVWSSGETTPYLVIQDTGTFVLYGLDDCGDTLFIENFIIQCEEIEPEPNSNCTNNDVKGVNIFTPNSDGVNDLFFLNLEDCQEVIEFIVVNRWGEPVYRSDQMNGWDGTVNGVACSDGTYFWELTYEYEKQEHTKRGFVALLR